VRAEAIQRIGLAVIADDQDVVRGTARCAAGVTAGQEREDGTAA